MASPPDALWDALARLDRYRQRSRTCRSSCRTRSWSDRSWSRSACSSGRFGVTRPTTGPIASASACCRWPGASSIGSPDNAAGAAADRSALPPRVARSMHHRPAFSDTVVWLEIFGDAPDAVERWKQARHTRQHTPSGPAPAAAGMRPRQAESGGAADGEDGEGAERQRVIEQLPNQLLNCPCSIADCSSADLYARRACRAAARADPGVRASRSSQSRSRSFIWSRRTTSSSSRRSSATSRSPTSARAARRRPPLARMQHASQFLQGESNHERPLDQPHALHDFRLIAPVSGGRSGDTWKQAEPFVVTERVCACEPASAPARGVSRSTESARSPGLPVSSMTQLPITQLPDALLLTVFASPVWCSVI